MDANQAAQMKPIEVFEMIANLFGVFDESSTALGVQKIETIGDAYWARSGDVAGGKCLPKHATALALFGFKMQVRRCICTRPVKGVHLPVEVTPCFPPVWVDRPAGVLFEV